jgi:hypothetical protein
MQTFLPGSRIGQAHGTMRPVDPATGARDALAYAMYHPAAAFRQGGLKETMKLDMLGIPDALTRARELREEHAPQPGLDADVGRTDRSDTAPIGPVARASVPEEELAELVAQGAATSEEPVEDRDQMGMFQ